MPESNDGLLLGLARDRRRGVLRLVHSLRRVLLQDTLDIWVSFRVSCWYMNVPCGSPERGGGNRTGRSHSRTRIRTDSRIRTENRIRTRHRDGANVGVGRGDGDACGRVEGVVAVVKHFNSKLLHDGLGVLVKVAHHGV